MSVMRDYAKKPVRTRDIVSVKRIIAEGVACIIMGAILGGLFGYGLLFTGV